MIKTYFLYYPLLWVGYLVLKITGRTYIHSYFSFRKLFVLTKGKSNDKMSERLSKSQPPYSIKEAEGILGTLDESKISSIAQRIANDGYYIFDAKLSSDKIEDLVRFARSEEAELIPPSKEGVKKSLYNSSKILAPRYQFDEQRIMQHPLIQQLAVDNSLFAIAQKYLGCKPILDLTAMWWSAVFSKQASSEAAQLFHFDMDRIKFIKFFIYLTDVDTHTGPHCYVRGSHKYLPDDLWKDGRIQDKEIRDNFPGNDIIEISGSKGTIIAVDTRGLHKGKVLERGERLILQYEFTNSLFGAPYTSIDLTGKVLPKVKSVFQQYSHSYQRFTY
jgi:Phytanoyl-CoA dioxygenase (PhyH)